MQDAERTFLGREKDDKGTTNHASLDSSPDSLNGIPFADRRHVKVDGRRRIAGEHTAKLRNSDSAIYGSYTTVTNNLRGEASRRMWTYRRARTREDLPNPENDTSKTEGGNSTGWRINRGLYLNRNLTWHESALSKPDGSHGEKGKLYGRRSAQSKRKSVRRFVRRLLRLRPKSETEEPQPLEQLRLNEQIVERYDTGKERKELQLARDLDRPQQDPVKRRRRTQSWVESLDHDTNSVDIDHKP